MKTYNIHGDNIVECERTLAVILQALGVNPKSVRGPQGIAACPTFRFSWGIPGEEFVFTFLPGYGRWNQDILAHIRNHGGKLREATDAILTTVKDGIETPILSLEYCGALPAGNQAWQRSGRAYSYGQAGVPFLYVAELGGFELDANRRRKAARLPNPAVPFSYILLSIESKEPTFPVFLRSPGADLASVKSFEPFYGENELLELIRCCVLSQSLKSVKISLQKKVLALVRHLASRNGSRRNDTLSPEQWETALDHVLKGGDLVSYLVANAPLPWAKIAYIAALTGTTRQLMALASAMAIGLTSTKLPMCVIPSNKRKGFCEAVLKLYPGLSAEFTKWLNGSGNLAICWIMGFKPAGDDARPDRGLPPLARMLIGEKTDLLSVVYGPAPKDTWPLLRTAPLSLAANNGLWEAIIIASDALLVDSNTAPKSPVPAYTKAHWTTSDKQAAVMELQVAPTPNWVGEQDVDTVLHLLLARIAGPSLFEGLCNPPGGDWSGLSLLSDDRTTELRWLGLPRVTADGSKRPDHVFQWFCDKETTHTITIESKDAAADVENGIGPRLNNYVFDLVKSVPSVERKFGTDIWIHSGRISDCKKLSAISIAAFVATIESEVHQVARRASADLVLGFLFSKDRKSCTVLGNRCTKSGDKFWIFISSLDAKDIAVSFRQVQ